MKNSKFWIWFIPLILIACVGIYFMINNVNKINSNKKTDAIKIKEEYESLNNQDGYEKVNISDKNSYFLASYDDVKKLLDNGDGVLFIGNYKNNESRKALTILEEAISSTSIEKVHYIDLDKIDYLDYLKEELKVNEIKNGTVVTVQGGNVLIIHDEIIEHDQLLTYYRNMLQALIEACDENC